jgi:predicted phage terminase large subunit-like protein
VGPQKVTGIEPYKPEPGSDKYMRFAAQAIKFEAGRIYLPSQEPWVFDYIREIIAFPGAKHDDQVDSTSQALHFLGDRAKNLAVWEALGRS